eukprot:365032-Chlamydomonas_euryale.AAC.11
MLLAKRLKQPRNVVANVKLLTFGVKAANRAVAQAKQPSNAASPQPLGAVDFVQAANPPSVHLSLPCGAVLARLLSLMPCQCFSFNFFKVHEGCCKACEPCCALPARLQVLVAQLQSPSQLRRRGAAGAVKNCCMRAEGDGTLASLLRDDAVLAKMLEPISGAEKAK